jgi:hypothetical protein
VRPPVLDVASKGKAPSRGPLDFPWAAKDRLQSQNVALYPAVYRKPSEIQLVGRVIWASREFK